MDEIIKFLMSNPFGALATVDNGKPRVRPWGFMFEENGKFYFCTNNTKDVYNQLQKYPYAEFTSFSAEMAWVRLAGRVTFVNDLRIKNKVIENNPGAKEVYKSGDNPLFQVFCFEHGEASLTGGMGKKPKVYTF